MWATQVHRNTDRRDNCHVELSLFGTDIKDESTLPLAGLAFSELKSQTTATCTLAVDFGNGPKLDHANKNKLGIVYFKAWSIIKNGSEYTRQARWILTD